MNLASLLDDVYEDPIDARSRFKSPAAIEYTTKTPNPADGQDETARAPIGHAWWCAAPAGTKLEGPPGLACALQSPSTAPRSSRKRVAALPSCVNTKSL